MDRRDTTELLDHQVIQGPLGQEAQREIQASMAMRANMAHQAQLVQLESLVNPDFLANPESREISEIKGPVDLLEK